MGICAYCDRDRRLTREEVFPGFLLRRRPTYRTFIDHSREGRVLRSPPTVRDVCGPCNNGPLSLLDSYAKTLDERFFSVFVDIPVSITLRYSYGRLVRWLLKVCYNDARSTRRLVEEHRRFRGYILGPHNRAPGPLDVFAGVIAPSPPTLEERKAGLSEALYPPAIRIGHFKMIPVVADALALCRLVSIGSYLFVIAVWRPGVRPLIRRATLRAMTTRRGFGFLNRGDDRIVLRVACTHARRFFSSVRGEF